jgi:hypothetical protein
MGGSESTFENLCSFLHDVGYFRFGENVEEHVSSALDTLLDFGLFKAEWKKDDGTFKRYFIGRNELLNIFSEFKGKLMQKLRDIDFSNDMRKLRSLLHLQEAYEIIDDRYYYSKRIQDVEEDFIKFIKTYVLREEHQIVYPLVRKAWAIFEHLKDEHQIESAIPIEYSIPSERLINKKVCVFDDAVDEGKRLCATLDTLVKFGLDPQNIYVVAYIVNKDNYFKPENKYRKEIERILGKEITIYKALNNLEFHRRVSDILMYIASFGSIIDPDHFVIKIKLDDPITYIKVMEALEKLNIGKILEPGVYLQYLHPNKKKITIDAIDYSLVVGETLPESVEKISQCKVRTIWYYNDKFQTDTVILTPIINPVVIDKLSMGLKCKLIPSLKFCEMVEANPILRRYNNICVDCTLFHMITRFLEKFLDIFSSQLNVRMTVNNLKWVEFESKYESIQLLMQELQNFKDKILAKYT